MNLETIIGLLIIGPLVIILGLPFLFFVLMFVLAIMLFIVPLGWWGQAYPLWGVVSYLAAFVLSALGALKFKAFNGDKKLTIAVDITDITYVMIIFAPSLLSMILFWTKTKAWMMSLLHHAEFLLQKV